MTKHKDIIDKIAIAHNTNPQVVEDLVDYMWHLIIRCFNDDRMPMVRLPFVGTWLVKPTKLKKLLKAMEKPDYKWKDKPDFDEYRARIEKIYERRLREEYANFKNKRIPVTVREDVEKLRPTWQ